MSEIKILHLFSRLLSLYGEYGNVTILEKTLTDKGHSVTVDRMEFLPDDLSGYNLVYMGAGTEADIMVAAQRLGDSEKEYISNGGLWLATGNSVALLGAKIQYKDQSVDGLGAFGFTTNMSHEERWLGDVITTDKNQFGAHVIGYINTSSVYEGADCPLFELMLGADLGNDKNSAFDGIVSKGVVATQLTGPLLVKNPAVLAYYYEKLTGEALDLSEDNPIRLAYNNALAQLTKRITE